MALIYTIPQNHVVLIERFGRYARTQRDGLAFKLPVIEKVKRVPEWNGIASKDGYMIELFEQQTDTPPRQCQTIDNVTIEANASIYWRITDPVKAVYEVDNLPKAIADIALNALRSNIGKLKFDQVLSERQHLNEKISAQLSEIASKWGVIFTRVEIQEINYTSEIAEAMMQEMAAERKRRAIIAEAEGEAAAEIKKAEALAQATKIRAQAQAEAIKIVADAEGVYLSKLNEVVSPEVAGNIIISQKYIDGMNIISKNPGDKVFLPNNFSGLFNIPVDHKG